ncbi:hypothetical protein Lbys_0717 [Leadbetterella byssophila DSM 17132]|uniref:Uncharacterized protein n=1 Tax=Leadbetterella byssophila (strain DSM 17132 / JCM 16389 / KACC 11308 / NBRC 106382 / 4M15) TaxID=649349 RepID=E4RZE0_LEAB4|nr:hypothetical protein Lbys_0717 [Leadbetterella byssophila DSM 17132]
MLLRRLSQQQMGSLWLILFLKHSDNFYQRKKARFVAIYVKENLDQYAFIKSVTGNSRN